VISQQLSGETETSSAAKQLVAGEPDVGGVIRRGCRDRLQSFLLRSFLCPTHALKNRSRLLTTAVRTVQDSRGPECCAAVFDYKTFRSSGRYSDALLHDSPTCADTPAPSAVMHRNSRKPHCPSSSLCGSCCNGFYDEPAPPETPRSSTDCHDPKATENSVHAQATHRHLQARKKNVR